MIKIHENVTVDKKIAYVIYEWPISARMHRIAEESLPLERLVVDLELAKEMFSDSIHKKKQIPSIAKNSPPGTKWDFTFEFSKSQNLRNFFNFLCIDKFYCKNQFAKHNSSFDR